MDIRTSNVAAAVPLFRTVACGVMTVPESTVPVGATIETGCASPTLTLTCATTTSLAVTRSPVSIVVQRTANGPPRWTGVQSAKFRVWVAPDARLVTVCVFVYPTPMDIRTSNVTAAPPLLRTVAWGTMTAPESTVPTGALIESACASDTVTVTSVVARSFADTMSLASIVVQRTVYGPPRWIADQLAKATV